VGAAQVVIVGAAPSCCKPPDGTIAVLDTYIRNFSDGNPLDTLDGVSEMCADLQTHLRKATQQTEALVLTNYQQQCGQNPRRWQVSAVSESFAHLLKATGEPGFAMCKASSLPNAADTDEYIVDSLVDVRGIQGKERYLVK
jgi:hypothetical protein